MIGPIQQPSEARAWFHWARQQHAGVRVTVYFIQCDGPGQPVKIGISSDFAYRIKSLQTASPYDLQLLARIQAHPRVEQLLHELFAGDRMRGEWFRWSSRLGEFAAAAKLIDDVERALDEEDELLYGDAA